MRLFNGLLVGALDLSSFNAVLHRVATHAEQLAEHSVAVREEAAQRLITGRVSTSALEKALKVAYRRASTGFGSTVP
jgi:hypothetical protein